MKRAFCGAFFIAVFLFAGASVSGEVLTSGELIEESDIYDGKEVIYRGEVIGEVMRRGDYAWVNVNDGHRAIGVWARTTDVENLGYFGSYGVKGDIIEVKGTFHESCPEHGGDLDIHAEEIKLIRRGEGIALPLDERKVRMSLVLGAVTLLLLIIYVIKKRVVKS